MHKFSVALAAAALAAIPLTHAHAFTYGALEGDWGITGKNRGTILFTCGMTRLADEAKNFSFVAQVRRVPFLMKASIAILTKLGDGSDLKGTLAFKDGKTFSFTGSTKGGIAALNVPENRGREISEAFDAEKPVKVTLTRPGSPPEITDIDLTKAGAAVSEKQACMLELMDKANVLPEE